MASENKRISELAKATSLNDDSLLVAEQNGAAVSVSGSLLKSSAVSELVTGTETDSLPRTEYGFTAGNSYASLFSFTLGPAHYYYVEWGNTDYECGVPTTTTRYTYDEDGNRVIVYTLTLKSDAFEITYTYDKQGAFEDKATILAKTSATSVRIFTSTRRIKERLIAPSSAVPMDGRSYFWSKADADAAAATACELGGTSSRYYYGQKLLVAENGVDTYYIIARDGTLVEEGSGVDFTTDDTLTLDEDGVLKVNVIDEVCDSQRPITSAAVNTTVGNISSLLETI